MPIIFLTAYFNEEQHVLEGYESGAVDYVHKPINARVLRSKVAVFAELHRRQRQASVANRKLLDEVVARGRVEEQLRELNNTLELRATDRTEALATQKRLYQSITDNASVALFITDNQHRCVFMNPAAELLTGFTVSASCGRVLQDVVQCAQAVDLTRLLEPRDATEVASAAKRRA